MTDVIFLYINTTWFKTVLGGGKEHSQACSNNKISDTVGTVCTNGVSIWDPRNFELLRVEARTRKNDCYLRYFLYIVMNICVDGAGQCVRLMFLPVPALRLMFFRFLHPATPSANQSNLIKSILNTHPKRSKQHYK
jgi:hypothetical protein